MTFYDVRNKTIHPEKLQLKKLKSKYFFSIASITSAPKAYKTGIIRGCLPYPSD